MADKTTIGIRVPSDLERRFEEFREERDLSKSDAGRRLLDRGLEAVDEDAPREDAERADDGDGGYLRTLLPSAATAFLAAALVLVTLGEPSGAGVSGVIGGLAALGVQGDIRADLPEVIDGTDAALDARKSLLRGYVALAGLGIIFGIAAGTDRLLIAGVIEGIAFVVAVLIVWHSLRHDKIAGFAQARLLELGLFIAGILTIFVGTVIGVPTIIVQTGGFAVLIGWVGIVWSSIVLTKETFRDAGVRTQQAERDQDPAR